MVHTSLNHPGPAFVALPPPPRRPRPPGANSKAAPPPPGDSEQRGSFGAAGRTSRIWALGKPMGAGCTQGSPPALDRGTGNSSVPGVVNAASSHPSIRALLAQPRRVAIPTARYHEDHVLAGALAQSGARKPCTRRMAPSPVRERIGWTDKFVENTAAAIEIHWRRVSCGLIPPPICTASGPRFAGATLQEPRRVRGGGRVISFATSNHQPASSSCLWAGRTRAAMATLQHFGHHLGGICSHLRGGV